MGWTQDGSMQCDCGRIFPSIGDELETSQLAIGLGWGYSAGLTHGGVPFEHIACPDCRGGSRRRVIKRARLEEDVPFEGIEFPTRDDREHL